MSGWQPIETAPRDGTPVKVRYADGIEGAARWLTGVVGKKGSRARVKRSDLISKYGGYWSEIRITEPSRSRPLHWCTLPTDRP